MVDRSFDIFAIKSPSPSSFTACVVTEPEIILSSLAERDTNQLLTLPRHLHLLPPLHNGPSQAESSHRRPGPHGRPARPQYAEPDAPSRARRGLHAGRQGGQVGGHGAARRQDLLRLRRDAQARGPRGRRRGLRHHRPRRAGHQGHQGRQARPVREAPQHQR